MDIQVSLSSYSNQLEKTEMIQHYVNRMNSLVDQIRHSLFTERKEMLLNSSLSL
jgi:competence transcription factor ComK